MTTHKIKHTFSPLDVEYLNQCIGKEITFITLFDTNQTACSISDGIVEMQSNSGGACFLFERNEKNIVKERNIELRLSFLPQQWSVFGGYGILQPSWNFIRNKEMNEWRRENSNANTFITSFKTMTIKAWRIYGAFCEGTREDDDSFDGDTFEVDLDLLLAFLGEDGRVLYCTFQRFPETSSGILSGIYSSLDAFEETMSYGENYYGEKIFTLKRRGGFHLEHPLPPA